MEIREDYRLKKHNTFGIDATTSYWVRYDSVADLECLSLDEFYRDSRKLFIGEGSNLLFLANFNGIILSSGIVSIEETKRTTDYVELRVGSGVGWDDIVSYCVDHAYYGAENLSYIPGTVGAAAIQNIGAYGVEAQQLIRTVETYDMEKRGSVVYRVDECAYGYRDSLFKHEGYEEVAITHVTFRLQLHPSYCLSYADIAGAFVDKMPSSAAAVRKVVMRIRKAKLPEPSDVGSAGSFFKNPIISASLFEELKQKHPHISHHILPFGQVKLSAAWLIDQSGLKGYRKGDAGVYERQPLVLVNYGQATGRDIAALAEYVQQAVFQCFRIKLEPEVRYV